MKHPRLVAIITVLLFLLQPASVFAASTGATSPGTMGVDASIGVGNWSNPDNAKANDNAYANTNTIGISRYLKGTNFGFDIPTNATINGVEVGVDYFRCTTDLEEEVRLVVGGSITGDNKATGASLPDGSSGDPNTLVTYGSPTDLWGLSISPSDVNASTFGTAVATDSSGVSANCDSSWTVRLDYMVITVYYTVAATSEPSGGGGNAAWLIRLRQQNGLDYQGNPISSSSSSASTEEPTNEVVTMSGATEGTTFSASTSVTVTQTKDWSWVSNSDPAPAAWIVSFRVRVCDRVERWFAPKSASVLTSVLPRLNNRLKHRWGFGCTAPAEER